MDASAWISLAALGVPTAAALIGIYVKNNISLTVVNAKIEAVEKAVTDHEKIRDRVLVLENEGRHQDTALVKIETSVSKLSSDVSETFHKIRNALQTTELSIQKMAVQIESIEKAVTERQRSE